MKGERVASQRGTARPQASDFSHPGVCQVRDWSPVPDPSAENFANLTLAALTLPPFFLDPAPALVAATADSGSGGPSDHGRGASSGHAAHGEPCRADQRQRRERRDTDGQHLLRMVARVPGGEGLFALRQLRWRMGDQLGQRFWNRLRCGFGLRGGSVVGSKRRRELGRCRRRGRLRGRRRRVVTVAAVWRRGRRWVDDLDDDRRDAGVVDAVVPHHVDRMGADGKNCRLAGPRPVGLDLGGGER